MDEYYIKNKINQIEKKIITYKDKIKNSSDEDFIDETEWKIIDFQNKIDELLEEINKS